MFPLCSVQSHAFTALCLSIVVEPCIFDYKKLPQLIDMSPYEICIQISSNLSQGINILFKIFNGFQIKTFKLIKMCLFYVLQNITYLSQRDLTIQSKVVTCKFRPY